MTSRKGVMLSSTNYLHWSPETSPRAVAIDLAAARFIPKANSCRPQRRFGVRLPISVTLRLRRPIYLAEADPEDLEGRGRSILWEVRPKVLGRNRPDSVRPNQTPVLAVEDMDHSHQSLRVRPSRP
jgi:hypothetical protein